jgi:hypothetical protein
MENGEYVFINGGEVYKQNIFFSGNDKSKFNYVNNYTDDPIAPIAHIKDNGTKIYVSTKEMREYLGVQSGESLTGYDMCPDVTLWCGRGYYTNDLSEYDLYFKIDNSNQLNQIASYYNLPYPIDQTITDKLDNDYVSLSMYGHEENLIVLGAVRFENNSPTLLKMYCLIKTEDNKSALQLGKAYTNNGNVCEIGMQYLTHGKEGLKYSSKIGDNITAEYTDIKYNISEGDPFMSWKATITDASTGIVKTKFYESSKSVRTAIANYSIGSDFESYDKSPNINYWLGRSYIEDGETELFFNAEDSDMLDEVCSYYNLPVPYNDDVKELLNNNRSLIRFKSYDLNRLGEGNFVELVVAGVVFENDQATQIKLYTNRRWNE